MKVLLEMRPALDGHAGIPQETRLLFHGLNALSDVSVDGLIQSHIRTLARGLPARRYGRLTRESNLSVDAQINRLARVVISMQQTTGTLLPKRIGTVIDVLRSSLSIIARQSVGATHELTHFEATHFRDFVWRTLFAKTLDPKDMDEVIGSGFRVASVSWGAMHRFGLLTRPFAGHALYPRLDTRGYDLLIAETPYPGYVGKTTQMIVRYHDAIPMLMPHTISDKAYHQAAHYQALRANVRAGAWFSCVSNATRSDLLSIFPEVESRSLTIYNMISQYYFKEESSPERVPEVLRTRRHTSLQHGRSGEVAPEDSKAPLNYLLMVSTIEPRKNHLTLLSAWERMRTQRFPDLKLILVGMLGWDHKAIVRKLRPWLERGQVVMLEDVPADELRLLYRHARATVCPSLYEGFDFSGVEAMRCGGVVAASDIPVHREIYGDAAEYFSPYSPEDVAEAITRLIASENGNLRNSLVERGDKISSRYLPQQLLPEWQRFLHAVMSNSQGSQARIDLSNAINPSLGD